jgi:hypothetical protein
MKHIIPFFCDIDSDTYFFASYSIFALSLFLVRLSASKSVLNSLFLNHIFLEYSHASFTSLLVQPLQPSYLCLDLSLLLITSFHH